ncbi:MAG: AMP-binding protein [Candidatus Protochlamydia sp.]|nr:AMP-binding protein [Candidatus Protochlamydia sp.]
MINWSDTQSYVLCNPAYSQEKKDHYQKLLEVASDLKGHIWFATSGSTVQKWVGLSKKALLASAEGVNQHLDSNSTDIWLKALPDFHVGGLGIWSRAYLSGATLIDYRLARPGKWKGCEFFTCLENTNATLTSLVPAQLYDLALLGRPPPTTLRAVIIGGGALIPELYKKAVDLGWPILPSYGLTECASSVATAILGSWENKDSAPVLKILNHADVKSEEGRLRIKSSSLLSAYAIFEKEEIYLKDPKVNGWFQSEDRGEVNSGFIAILGRLDGLVKIGGENVDMARLEALFSALYMQSDCKEDYALVSMPDARLGQRLILAIASEEQSTGFKLAIERFQASVLPFEEIRQVCLIPSIPRSPLSKVSRPELIKILSEYIPK